MMFEKTWYSISDLCERWDLTFDDVFHLSIDHKIKLFVDLRKKAYDTLEFVWAKGSPPLGDYMPVWQSMAIQIMQEPNEIFRVGRGFVACPFTWEKEDSFTIDYTIVGRQQSERVNYVGPPEFSVFVDDIGMPLDYLKDLEKGKAENQQHDLIYETDLVVVLRASMEQLFSADRESDPKKDAAVIQIIEIGRKRGITVSMNIAEAIFTIIKPDDHNPKAKRVKV